jgi:hypothetical protein
MTNSVITQARMGGLSSISIFQALYDNAKNSVAIPLYENMTTEQLAIRLPISLGIARQIVTNAVDSLFGEKKLLGIKMVGNDQAALQAAWDKFFTTNNMPSRLISDATTLFIQGGIFYFINYQPAKTNVFQLVTIPYVHLWDIEVPDDIYNEPEAFIFQWETSRVEGDQTFYRWKRTRFDATTITNYAEKDEHPDPNDGKNVELLVTDVAEHGLGIMPLVHIPHQPQTGYTLGTSAIEPLRPMIDALNQMYSDAWWQLYNDQSVIKAFNIKPPTDDEPENANIRLGGDQIHFLTKLRDGMEQDIERLIPVGLHESVFKLMDLLTAQIFKTADEIYVDPAKWSSTNISGEALRIFSQPVAKKTHRNRITWEDTLDKLSALLFRTMQSRSIKLDNSNNYIIGSPPQGFDTTEVDWGEILSDEKFDQEIILNDLMAGLITQALAQKMRGLPIQKIATPEIGETAQQKPNNPSSGKSK